MKTRVFLIAVIGMLLMATTVFADYRQYTETDGLLTREIHQVVELPDRRIMVNCEGAFCLFDGEKFVSLACERNRTYKLEHYVSGYAHYWQGDTLLWLRDYYRLYLYDARIHSFRYDIASRLESDASIREFAYSNTRSPELPTEMLGRIEEDWDVACFTTDWQGGVWMGTRRKGVFYFYPEKKRVLRIMDEPSQSYQVQSLTDSKGYVWHWRNHAGLMCHRGDKSVEYQPGNVRGLTHNQINFLTEMPDQYRFLMCYTLRELGYFYPEKQEFVSLNSRIPQLNQYRYFVGADVLDARWTVVYTQSGAFLLDVVNDSIAPFPPVEIIEQYSDKYNCMHLDRKGCLWIGTQNGLFVAERNQGDWQVARIEGLSNNCIRSLVEDTEGHVWVGTSCGISRVSPVVINLSSEDGVCGESMVERSACLMPDGMLAFECADHSIVTFHPHWFELSELPLRVVLTGLVAGTFDDLLSMPLWEELSLPYNQNYVSFSFSALNYATPSHTRYRYRLCGVENDWIAYHGDGASATIEYRALSPGNYIFQVQAAIDDQEWGIVTEKTFTIRPPFWLTWWAKSLYSILSAFLLLWAISTYLKKKKVRMERDNDNRVNRLFELREEARHQFAVSTNINPKNISINSDEENFISLLLEAIRNNLSNADYNVELLAKDVAISRSNLYDKMRTMLGITPSDFIRNVRLKHAAQLLTESQLSVADIAFQSGFNTPRVFSSHFKNMFGMLPSEYRANVRDEVSLCGE